MGGTKHAKNIGALGLNSRHEKGRLDWRSKETRVHADSIKKWDHCTLCLKVAEDAMVCPKGDLFCKACIYEYIYSKKKANEKQLRAYHEQNILEDKLGEEHRQKEEIDKFLAFERLESGVVTTCKAKEQRNHVQLKKDDVGSQLTSERRTVFQDNKAEMKVNAYWCPQVLPSQHQAKVKRPAMRVLCPGCCDDIKLKKLIAVRFTKIPVDTKSDKDRFMCPSCRNTLTNKSKVCVLSKCAHAICLYCVKNFVAKEKQCPICGHKCKKKHVIQMKCGGTGFTASGQQMTTKESKVTCQS